MTKFERDKVYKTRDGRDARVICVDAPGPYPIVGFIESSVGSDRWSPQGWFNSNVGYAGEPEYPDPRDLMLPKPEPIVEWGLVRVSDNQWADGYGTERTARAIAADPENIPRFRLAKRVTTFED